MSDPGPVLTPSTPDAATVTQAMTIVRAVLAISSGAAGAMGIVLPNISDAQLSNYITAILILYSAASAAGTFLWGVWKNRRAAALDHAGNVASAQTGVPTKVIA